MDDELKKQIKEIFGDTVNTKMVFPFTVHRDTLDPELFDKIICRETEDMVFCFLELAMHDDNTFSSNFISEDRAKASGLKYKDLIKLAHSNIISFGELETTYIDNLVNIHDTTDAVKVPERYIFYTTRGAYFVSGIIFYPDIMSDIMAKCGYDEAYLLISSTCEIYCMPMSYTPEVAYKLLEMFNNEWEARNPDYTNTIFPVTRHVYHVKADGSIKRVEVNHGIKT